MEKTLPQLSDIPASAKGPLKENNTKTVQLNNALKCVLPTGRSTSTLPSSGASQDICDALSNDKNQVYPLSFLQAFGLLGIPILLLLGSCIIWTIWLILLMLAPNKVANQLMHTEDYDNGLFWLIEEDSTIIKVTSVVGFVIIEIYYIYILAKVLVWRTCEVPFVRVFMRLKKSMMFWRKSVRISAVDATKNPVPVQDLWNELTGIHGKYRKFWNLFSKAVDLVVETIALLGYLSDGFPPLLVYGWAGFISMNSLSCALNILVSKHSALNEIILDTLFDLVAAVVYPILVLAYCHHHFEFGHDIIDLFKRVIHPNGFDDMGRLFANQAQLELFRVNFDSLRIETVLDVFVHMTMNFSFCSRFHAVVVELIHIHRRALYPRRPTSFRVQISKQVQKPVAIVFLVFSALVVGYTHIAIHSSWAVCNQHPECVVYMHRFSWSASSEENCPCLALIDEDSYIMAWEKWDDLADVTAKVKVLANAGKLRTLRLINRQLVTLPVELRQCSSMKHLTLVHTQTKELPDWARTWNKLEYLHIEGKPGGASLQTLPSELFEDMPSLTLINLAQHPLLDSIPALNGAPSLRSLTLGSLPFLQELPVSFDKISAVSQLVLFNLPRLTRIPDMTPLASLTEFSLIKPSHLCCNGFLNTCNKTDPFCAADAELNLPDAECVDSVDINSTATEATRAVFQKFDATTCHQASYLTGMADLPTEERTEMCSHTFFKQCEFPPGSGQIGMCIPYRMRILSCTLNEAFMEFRRLEISELGMPCNPSVENWLGCTG